MDSTPAPEVTYARIKEQFAPAYLTLTSIIQGVAISALVVHIEAAFDRLAFADWLLAAATLLAFLLIWHEYLMQALAYVWLPTLLDSIVPFAFLVAELFTAHFAIGNQRAWFLAASITYAVGAAAWGTTRTQASAQKAENLGVLSAIGEVAPLRLALALIPAALCILVWALYDVLRLDHIQLVVSLFACAAVVASIGATVPYWNRVLDYVRGAREAV